MLGIPIDRDHATQRKVICKIRKVGGLFRRGRSGDERRKLLLDLVQCFEPRLVGSLLNRGVSGGPIILLSRILDRSNFYS